MKSYRVYNVEYDIDEEDEEVRASLLTELTYDVVDDFDPEEDLCQLISDTTDWCVVSFSFEEIPFEEKKGMNADEAL